MWFLEVEPPPAPTSIQLVRASIASLEIQWSPVANAEHYLLQVQKVESEMEPSLCFPYSI